MAPARNLRETETQPVLPVIEAPAPQDQPEGSVLIVPSRPLQLVAVEMVLADFEAAKTAREARDYGLSAKGEKLDYDK